MTIADKFRNFKEMAKQRLYNADSGLEGAVETTAPRFNLIENPAETYSMRNQGQAGFTLSELLIVVATIGILSVIAIGENRYAIDRARVTRCMQEVNQVHDFALDYLTQDTTPTFKEFDSWMTANHNSSSKYKNIGIAFNENDANSGHGNDLDYVDEDNKGKADRESKHINFVVGCKGHTHPDVWMPNFISGEPGIGHGKYVQKVFRGDGHQLDALEEGDKDWFSRFVDKNYK